MDSTKQEWYIWAKSIATGRVYYYRQDNGHILFKETLTNATPLRLEHAIGTRRELQETMVDSGLLFGYDNLKTIKETTYADTDLQPATAGNTKNPQSKPEHSHRTTGKTHGATQGTGTISHITHD